MTKHAEWLHLRCRESSAAECPSLALRSMTCARRPRILMMRAFRRKPNRRRRKGYVFCQSDLKRGLINIITERGLRSSGKADRRL